MTKLIDVEALASVNVLLVEVIGDPEGDAVYVEWQPGNGTRYQMMFSRIHPLAAKRMGCSTDAVLVSRVSKSTGRSWPFGSNGLVHFTYVKEAFDLEYEGDHWAITALINIALPQCPTDYGIECLDRACNRAA